MTEQAAEFVRLCFARSPVHPSDGLPCGNNANRVLVTPDVVDRPLRELIGDAIFVCWRCRYLRPSLTRLTAFGLDRDGRVYELGEQSHYRATLGYLEDGSPHDSAPDVR